MPRSPNKPVRVKTAVEDGPLDAAICGARGLRGCCRCRPRLLPNSKSITIMGFGAISGRMAGQEEPYVWTLSNPCTAAFYNV